MPRYLFQASYSSQGVADLIKSPQNRAEAVRPVVERMGGKLESFDFVLGDFDVVAIAEMPDNVSMTAMSMAISATSAISSFKTSVLLSADEAVEAMKKASGTGYKPPGG